MVVKWGSLLSLLKLNGFRVRQKNPQATVDSTAPPANSWKEVWEVTLTPFQDPDVPEEAGMPLGTGKGGAHTDTFEPVSGPWKTRLLVGLSPGLGQEHWGGVGHSCPHRAPTVSYCLTGPGACIPRLLE